jgi:hypothetical protein
VAASPGQIDPATLIQVAAENPSTKTVQRDFVPLTAAPQLVPAGGTKSAMIFCDGHWQDNGAGNGYYPLWFEGDEFYAAYQDPETLGSCAGSGGLYPFDVRTIRWWVFEQDGGTTYDFQPLVYDDVGVPGCPFPGNVVCTGPLYQLTLPLVLPYILDLPLPEACCVAGPYFAGVYVPTVTGQGVLGLVAANPDGSATPCRIYNDRGYAWYDLDDSLSRNLHLWSEGVAADQNNCPGGPADCEWQEWHDEEAYFWLDPDANCATDYFVRFESSGECALHMARFAVYCPRVAGTPTVRVRVYGSNGPVDGGRMYPDTQIEGANYLGYTDIPYAQLNCYPAWNYVDLSGLGPLSFGTDDTFFITLSLSPATPNPGTDTIAFISDNEFGALSRSGAWCSNVQEYEYYDESFGSPDYNLLLEAFYCCEPPIDSCPSLSAPSPIAAVANEAVTNQVTANDPEGDDVEFFRVSGPGSVGINSGEWSYTPTCADIPGFDVIVEASDRGAGACSTVTFHVDVAPPPLSPACGYYVYSAACDDLAARSISVTGGCPPYGYAVAGGPGAIDGAGNWSYQTSCASAPDTQDVTIEITDDAGQSETCSFMLVIRAPYPGTCICPYQCDYDEDGFITSLDLSGCIDILFQGAPDVQDPDCPITRTDFDCDGFATAIDLAGLIEHLFNGGEPPCDLCF